jgi:hypothetical protein
MSGVVLVNAAGVLSLLSYQKLYLRGKIERRRKFHEKKIQNKVLRLRNLSFYKL